MIGSRHAAAPVRRAWCYQTGLGRIWAGPTGLLIAGIAAIALGGQAAEAGTISITPKGEQTINAQADGSLGPKKLKYRLKTDTGKTRWKLGSVPKWLLPAATKGTAKPRKSTLVIKANRRKIARMDAGIYSKTLKFTYSQSGDKVKAKRVVTLIVEGDPADGLQVYNAKCSGCHDLDINLNGPMLRAVYGRKAGTTPGFSHSEELIAYGEIWQERNLDKWLENPQKLVKGSDMFLSLKKGEDRMNVIAYLKSVKP